MTSFNEFQDILVSQQKRAPVQMVPLARALGLKVYRVGGMPDWISGKIYRSAQYGGESGYAIDVNKNHAPVRRRFTIAHEIAHFVLHRDQIGDELFDDEMYRSGLSNVYEWQANGLAAKILMPDHLLQRALARGIRDPKGLSEYFEVSKDAARIRLEKYYANA